MKTIKNDMDIEFIGGQGAMTKEEELLVGNFIKVAKLKKNRYVAKGQSKVVQGQAANI